MQAAGSQPEPGDCRRPGRTILRSFPTASHRPSRTGCRRPAPCYPRGRDRRPGCVRRSSPSVPGHTSAGGAGSLLPHHRVESAIAVRSGRAFSARAALAHRAATGRHGWPSRQSCSTGRAVPSTAVRSVRSGSWHSSPDARRVAPRRLHAASGTLQGRRPSGRDCPEIDRQGVLSLPPAPGPFLHRLAPRARGLSRPAGPGKRRALAAATRLARWRTRRARRPGRRAGRRPEPRHWCRRLHRPRGAAGARCALRSPFPATSWPAVRPGRDRARASGPAAVRSR